MYKEILKKLKQNEDKSNKKLIEAYAKALANIKKEILIETSKNAVESGENSIRLNKLLSLEKQINSIIDNLYKQSEEIIIDHTFKMYEDKYYGNLYGAEKELGMQFNFNMIDERQVEIAVNSPVDGIKLSDRLHHKHLPKLKQEVQEVLVEGTIQGYGYDKMARKLADRVGNTDYKVMKRILRTEGGRLSSIGTLDSFEEMSDLGIEFQKQWLATLDDRTRDRHAELDGQIVGEDENFEIDGYEAPAPHMFGIEEMDINCRCDVISIVEGVSPTARRDNITKEAIPFTTYEEWYENRVSP